MPKDEKTKDFKYEYDHYDLGYGLHYGMHSIFGEHIALGTGANMVHIYPYKIFIGENKTNAIDTSPEQRRILKNIFKIIGRRIEAAHLSPEHDSGVIDTDTI